MAFFDSFKNQMVSQLKREATKTVNNAAQIQFSGRV